MHVEYFYEKFREKLSIQLFYAFMQSNNFDLYNYQEKNSDQLSKSLLSLNDDVNTL